MSANKSNIFKADDYKGASYDTDYLVIGSGAGGSVAAALIAEKGYKVIVVEEGPYVPTSALNDKIGQMTSLLYRDHGIFPFLGKPSLAFAEGKCVGGGSVINGGLIWRTPNWILEDWEKNHGLSGYNSENLVKYFERIEENLCVSDEEQEDDENVDSYVIKKGADKLGWKNVMAKRAVKNCINENLCPTGCISGAKQSMLITYLQKAVDHGALLFSECKAIKILSRGRKAYKVIAQVHDNNKNGKKRIEINFNNLIVAAGAIQTPHLLKRSNILKKSIKNLQFHINLKVVAIFNKTLDAERGTMFTVQVQEFEKQGLLMMASNVKPHYIAMTLSHFNNHVINRVLKYYRNSSIYVSMIKPRSKAKIYSWFKKPLVMYSIHKSDIPAIKYALLKLSQLLFESGASEIYLPIAKSQKAVSLPDVEEELGKAKKHQFQLMTVHVMGSCPMGTGETESVVGLDGRVFGFENIFITDASILPTNIGESPQGTIMAFAYKIIEEHLKER